MRSNSRHVLLSGLLPGKEYEIAVKVVGDDGRESPWSIRDVVLTPPDPSQKISQYDWDCDFEKDLCGMRNGDGVHWIRAGGTPAAESGQLFVELRDEKRATKMKLLQVSVAKLPAYKWKQITLPLTAQRSLFKEAVHICDVTARKGDVEPPSPQFVWLYSAYPGCPCEVLFDSSR
uniref:Fibronectin type-III domain-containing protein n=1 Tax=Angiostrongylus cantonensis TaxID=6313 RepID=A0A0K0CTF0_ANGCA